MKQSDIERSHCVASFTFFFFSEGERIGVGLCFPNFLQFSKFEKIVLYFNYRLNDRTFTLIYCPVVVQGTWGTAEKLFCCCCCLKVSIFFRS